MNCGIADDGPLAVLAHLVAQGRCDGVETGQQHAVFGMQRRTIDLLKEQNVSVAGLQPTGHGNRFLISKTNKGCLAWEARERATSHYQGLDVLVWNDDGTWHLPAFNTTLTKSSAVFNAGWVDLGKKIVLANPNTGLVDE